MLNASITRFPSIVLVAVVLAACNARDNSPRDTTAAGAPGSPAAGGSAVAPSGAMSDANIFAVLDAANVTDSAGGAIAATKGTASQVREFGKMMMRDHHAMRQQGERLAKKLSIVPTPPPGDATQADGQKALALFNTTAKGKDFDRAYIDHQVNDHKKVLAFATSAMVSAQSTELKNMLQKAAPIVLAHLDKVQAIQRSMK